MGIRFCAYCGSNQATTVDHVVPKSLYPASKASSKVQRITVPACEACNGSWADDEPHFRNMLLVSGEPNAAVRELWEGKTRRSFTHADGPRRIRDLTAQMIAVQMPESQWYMVYPGRDEHVTHVVRKVIRGLCHHHKLLSPVSDSQVWVDIQKFDVPPAFHTEMAEAHAEEDVLQYRFAVLDDGDIHSFWVLTFFERTPFFGIVFRSEDVRKRVQAEASREKASVSRSLTDHENKDS